MSGRTTVRPNAPDGEMENGRTVVRPYIPKI